MADDNTNTGTPDVDANNNNNDAGNNDANNSTVDYSKIESIMQKGVQQKESAILKSYFEQQGMTADEAKQAMDVYKADKAKKAEEKANELNTTKQELEALRAQVRQNAVNTKATELALDMGVDKNSLPYLIRMADLSKATNDKGEVDDSSIKTAFEQVLKDVPALRANNGNAGFKLGADNNQAQLEDDMLRRAAGLAPRKK